MSETRTARRQGGRAILGDALAMPERLFALRGRGAAAHLAPLVVDAEQAGEPREAAEIGRRPETRDQPAHQDRAQGGADTVESEQRAACGHHLRRLEMV